MVDGKKQADYVNLTRLIGSLISYKMATLKDLQTIYSLEDAYDLFEVLIIDSHNRAIMYD